MNAPIPENSKVLVRMPNWIGDAVMATAGLDMLHVNRPDLKLVVLLKPWVLDVIKSHPAVSDVIVYNPGRFPSRIRDFHRMAGRIRSAGFSACIMFQNNFESALMGFVARIPLRIGRPGDWRRYLLTHPVQVPTGVLKRHQVEHYLAIAHDVVNASPAGYRPRICLTGQDREEADRFVENLPGGGPILPVAAGAAYGSAKCWPSASMERFLDAAVRRWNARVVFLGGEQEKTMSDGILSRATAGGFSMVAEYPIMVQAALVEKAGLCIANDSGLMHVAAALDSVVTIAIFGPTNPAMTRPYGDRHIVLHHKVSCWPCKHRVCPTDHRCMTTISVEDVLNAVETALSKR
jgi:heptosyltransferase II